MTLWVVFVAMVAHIHGDVKFAHYDLNFYPVDSKHIIQSFAQLLHDLVKTPTLFNQVPDFKSFKELYLWSRAHY